MTRFLLSVAVLFGFNLTLNAQIEITPSTNVLYGSVEVQGQELDAVWNVINASSSTLDVRCKRLSLQEVSGSDGNFCWGFICTAWSTGNLNTSEMVTLAPGESTSTFHAKYRHHGNSGQSIFRYCFWDNNNQVDEICYDVNFCVDAECLVSTNEIDALENQLSLSPNPVVNTGNISYQFAQTPVQGKLKICNMVGAVVKEVNLSNRDGIVFISANDFEAGVYFCSIEDNGRIHQTVRLVIQ